MDSWIFLIHLCSRFPPLLLLPCIEMIFDGCESLPRQILEISLSLDFPPIFFFFKKLKSNFSNLVSNLRRRSKKFRHDNNFPTIQLQQGIAIAIHERRIK